MYTVCTRKDINTFTLGERRGQQSYIIHILTDETLYCSCHNGQRILVAYSCCCHCLLPKSISLKQYNFFSKPFVEGRVGCSRNSHGGFFVQNQKLLEQQRKYPLIFSIIIKTGDKKNERNFL